MPIYPGLQRMKIRLDGLTWTGFACLDRFRVESEIPRSRLITRPLTQVRQYFRTWMQLGWMSYPDMVAPLSKRVMNSKGV